MDPQIASLCSVQCGLLGGMWLGTGTEAMMSPMSVTSTRVRSSHHRPGYSDETCPAIPSWEMEPKWIILFIEMLQSCGSTEKVWVQLLNWSNWVLLLIADPQPFKSNSKLLNFRAFQTTLIKYRGSLDISLKVNELSMQWAYYSEDF